MTDLTAEHALQRVREWCERTETETSAWMARHNPDCHCEVGPTYLECVEEVRAVLPPVASGTTSGNGELSEKLDSGEILARILDPAAFNPDANVAEARRAPRQAAARIMADRAIAARYVRERGFWGCACPSCLKSTGRCPRCGRHEPAKGEALCRSCDRALEAELSEVEAS